MFTIKITEIQNSTAPGASPQPFTSILKAKGFEILEDNTSFKITGLENEEKQTPSCLEYLTEDQNPEINEFNNYRFNALRVLDCNYKRNFKCEVYEDEILSYILTLRCGSQEIITHK